MISKNNFKKMVFSFNEDTKDAFNNKFSNNELIDKVFEKLPKNLHNMAYDKLVTYGKSTFAIRFLKVKGKFDLQSAYGVDINSFLVDYFFTKKNENEFVLEIVINREHTEEEIFSYKEKFIL